MSEEPKMNIVDTIAKYKKGNSKSSDSPKWKNEQSQEVPMIFGNAPLRIERNIMEREDGKVIRVIQLIRGNRTISFDVEAADLIGLALGQVAGEYIPDELRRENIKK